MNATIASWDPALAGLIANHIWQSTLFLALAAPGLGENYASDLRNVLHWPEE